MATWDSVWNCIPTVLSVALGSFISNLDYHKHTPLTTPLAEKSRIENKRSHDHGKNGREIETNQGKKLKVIASVAKQ